MVGLGMLLMEAEFSRAGEVRNRWMAPCRAAVALSSNSIAPRLVLLDYPTPETEIVALYPQRRHLTAKVRAFVDILVDVFTAEQERWSDLSVAEIDQPVEN